MPYPKLKAFFRSDAVVSMGVSPGSSLAVSAGPALHPAVADFDGSPRSGPASLEVNFSSNASGVGRGEIWP